MAAFVDLLLFSQLSHKRDLHKRDKYDRLLSMAKVILRIPTDQYAYIELELEVENSEEAVASYFELKRTYDKRKKEEKDLPF